MKKTTVKQIKKSVKYNLTGGKIKENWTDYEKEIDCKDCILIEECTLHSAFVGFGFKIAGCSSKKRRHRSRRTKKREEIK